MVPKPLGGVTAITTGMFQLSVEDMFNTLLNNTVTTTPRHEPLDYPPPTHTHTTTH